LKEQMEKKGSRILKVKDEKEFYALIEERLEEQGFQVFKTSPPYRETSNTEGSSSAFNLNS